LLNIIFIEESNSLVMFQCSDQSDVLIHFHTAHVKVVILIYSDLKNQWHQLLQTYCSKVPLISCVGSGIWIWEWPVGYPCIAGYISHNMLQHNSVYSVLKL